MRYILLLSFPFALAAQSPDSDRITHALISEIQQLRVAIERSTLLNARTQLAISQLQMQETSLARVTAQFNDIRGASGATRIASLAERIKEREEQRASPQFATPPHQAQLAEEIRNMKEELAMFQANEAQRATREGELASELQRAQNQVSASRARIEEMERALDAAIQQMLKK